MEKWQLPSSCNIRAHRNGHSEQPAAAGYRGRQPVLDKFWNPSAAKVRGLYPPVAVPVFVQVIFSFDEKESKLLEFSAPQLFEQLETLSRRTNGRVV